MLSKTPSAGPASVWDGEEDHINNYDLDIEIWKSFVEYEDKDGFYFLQRGWQVNESKELNWTYYPPKEFKALLYYPESDIFLISEICERYAFHSYFTVNLEDNNTMLTEDVRVIEIYQSYKYEKEIISLIICIVITVLIEIIIAILFGFREKKQLLLILGVNVITQILLNVFLSIINYNSGYFAFIAFYILFELIVIGIEAVVFYNLLYKVSEVKKSKWYGVIYALIANLASFGLGLYLAQLIPSIF